MADDDEATTTWSGRWCTCSLLTGGARFSPTARPCEVHGAGWFDPGFARPVVFTIDRKDKT